MNFQKIGFVTFITCMLLILLANTGFSATYYVNATGGRDTNSGTTEGTAWKTIGKINSVNFTSGDTIKFKRGHTWTDATLTLNSTRLGTSGITVEDYGIGAKPRIDGNSVQPIVINHALVDLTLKNIDISGSDTTGNRCIIQYVNGLTIDGIDYNGHTGSSSYIRSNAINIVYVDGDIEIKNCTIQNVYKDTVINTIIAWGDYDAHGILLWYPGDENVKLSGTVNIHDNLIHDIYADCIQTAGVHTITNIYNNLLYHFGESALDLKASGHIDVYNNEMYHGDWGLANGGGFRGMAIVAAADSGIKWTPQYAPQQNVVRDNYIHSCKWQGIAAVGKNSKIYGNYFKDIGTAVTIAGYDGLEVYNNVFELTTAAASETTYAGTAYEFDWSRRYVATQLSAIKMTNANRDNTLVYNNTIYISSPNLLYGIAVNATAKASGSLIKNNCVYMTRNNASVFPLYVADYDNSGTLPTVTYNCLYNSGHSNRASIEETPGRAPIVYDSSDQSAWRAAGHTGGLFDDPGLEDVESAVFWPSYDTSPVVNAGVELTISSYGLHQNTIWPTTVKTVLRTSYGGHDIGAYEYVGADDSPNPILLAPNSLKVIPQ